MDKVFGWWRREGQEGQATQRQSTDPPACQGKIPLEKFSARLSCGEPRDELSEHSIHLNRFFRGILRSTILIAPTFKEQFHRAPRRKRKHVDPRNKKAHYQIICVSNYTFY